MPRYWHDKHMANKIKNETEKELCRNIVADKKPYFMRYIYPALMKQYNTYIKNTNKNSLREFQLTIPELQSIETSELTDRQRDFIHYYNYRMPVGTGDCVMNRICKRFEDEFDGHIRKHNSVTDFDYTIMKSDTEYTITQFKLIKKLYEDFNRRLQNYAVFADYERVDEYDSFNELSIMNEEFKKECSIICPDNAALCNIILDICYTKSSTKRFAWSMCSSEIIHNLLKKNNYIISVPTLDDVGEIEYCGNRFTEVRVQIGGVE